MSNNRWHKTPEEIATRIDLNDLESDGILRSKTIQIDHGCVGMLFEGNKIEVLKTGSHTLDTMLRFFNRWGSRKGSLLLVDSVDQILTVPGVQGKAIDGGEIWVETALALDINDPLAFSQHLMGGSPALTKQDMAQLLTPSIERAVRIALPRQDSHAWITRNDQRDSLATAIERSLVADFGKRGMRIARVDIIGLRAPDVENYQTELRRIRGKEAQTELDILEANVDIDSEESMLAVQIRRSKVLAQQRDLINDDQVDEATKAAHLQEALAELETTGAINAEQRKQAMADLRAEGEQKEAARAHAFSMICERQREEFEQTRIAIEHRLQMQRLDQEKEASLKSGDTRIANLRMQQEEQELQLKLSQQAAAQQRGDILAQNKLEIDIQELKDQAQVAHLKRLKELEQATLADEESRRDRQAARERDNLALAHQQRMEAERLATEKEIKLAEINKGDVTQIEIAKAQAAQSHGKKDGESDNSQLANLEREQQSGRDREQQMMDLLRESMATIGGIAQNQANALAKNNQPPQPGYAYYPPPQGYPYPPQQPPPGHQPPPNNGPQGS